MRCRHLTTMSPICTMPPLTSTLPLDGTALLNEVPSLKYRWIMVKVHVSVGLLWYSVFPSVQIMNILSDSLEERVNTSPLSIALLCKKILLQALTRALEGEGQILPIYFSRISQNGGVQRRRFRHSCLEFNNTCCVKILTS